MAKTSSTEPAVQTVFAKKAAKLKAAGEAKRAQPSWLQRQAPAAPTHTPPNPEHVVAAHQSQGPPRLLSKSDILAVTNVTFVTIWNWMRAGKFPRSRIVGGKSMWRSDEIDAWLSALPLRPLKGDQEAEAAE